MQNYTQDYLLDKKVKIFQPTDGYRASTDAVLLSAMPALIKSGDKILDVGSGTGAVSLCLAERVKNLNVSILGLDIQPQLVELSNLSAQENGFDFLHFDLVDIRKKMPSHIPYCSFNHVFSNPPYAFNDMPSPNQSKATAHNLSLIDLTAWINFCIKMTAPKGFFYMVNRAEALDQILAALYSKMGNIQVFPLFSKDNQPAKRVLVSAQKDSKAPTILHRGLIVHTENGDYSAQANDVLRLGKTIDFL